MTVGQQITCADTMRVGTFLARTATGEMVCQDRQGRFIVRKQYRKPRKQKPATCEQRTEWGAPIGGEPNPVAVELAAKAGLIKGATA